MLQQADIQRQLQKIQENYESKQDVFNCSLWLNAIDVCESSKIQITSPVAANTSDAKKIA